MAPQLLTARVMLFALLTTLVAVPTCADEIVPVERTVVVNVRPWADISVDDKLVARAAYGDVELTLPVGEHVLMFGNSAAYEETRVVAVPSTGAIPKVKVELRRRPVPAQMIVDANVPDADVEVCLDPVPAHTTQQKPIDLLIVDSPATVEVRISRRGFSTVTRKVEVDAGRPVRVDVHLARDQSTARVP